MNVPVQQKLLDPEKITPVHEILTVHQVPAVSPVILSVSPLLSVSFASTINNPVLSSFIVPVSLTATGATFAHPESKVKVKNVLCVKSVLKYLYVPSHVSKETKVSELSKVLSVETNIRGLVAQKTLALTLMTPVPTDHISETFQALLSL